MAKETLSRAEVNRVEVNVKRYWPKRGRRARAEAQGIEATLQLLKRNRDIDKVLISGRPAKGRPRNGPDT